MTIYTIGAYQIQTDNTHIAKSFALGKPYEWKLLEELQQYTGTFYDIGAHVGNHSVYLSLFGKFDNIYAFEPHQKHYEMLLTNLDMNKCKNVQPINLAISDKQGLCKVVEAGDNDGSYHIEPGGSVPMMPLDSLRYNPPSVVKIDVEGHEENVLNGAMHTLTKYKPVVYVELNWNVIKIKEILRKLGYRLEKIISQGSPMGKFVV